MNKKFYLTTAIPYVNAAPHIGHALEFVQADCVARYQKIREDKYNTLLLSGSDENALKNVQAAEQENIPIQDFVNKNSQLFEDLAKKLNVKFDVFQRGSSTQHYKSSQELWKRCFKNGDIYEETYSGLYCVGCEAFYERGELNERGECFEHPGKQLEEVSEKNWFFKLNKYGDRLLKIIEGKDKEFHLEIIPEKRRHEVLSFLNLGLKNISISRSNKRAKNWGVPVPNDDTQRIYVWFDALNIYQSGVGFNWNPAKYKKWWPADLHIIGKGILRFHAIYWPAFLLSAKLQPPKKIFVHGYITVDGQKISKTIGNVIDPFVLLDKYRVDPIRYYLLREIPAHSDGDFSERRFKEVYNADLANGLGNLVARIAKLIEIRSPSYGPDKTSSFSFDIKPWLENFQFDEALKAIWARIKGLDHCLEESKPWEKSGLHTQVRWKELIDGVRQIAFDLQPFLPKTAERIQEQFAGPKIKSGAPLFPRLC